MFRAIVLILLLIVAPGVSHAGSINESEQAEFQRIITEQIDAFRADDGARAYAYAAPNIQQIFPTSDIFLQMVKQRYQPVYRPQSFRFGPAGDDPFGRPSQKVTIVGPDGKSYEALYSMQRQSDGSWLIEGCTLLEVPGLDA
ncbi:MAG TPA: DUF4864 domain-containing protein [Aestuariivirga sp.]|nr:DUF4864 domain-containing protein [Aestuariivirga sp.]